MFQFLVATGNTVNPLTALLPMVLVFGIMYFLMIRPENKRKKEAERMRDTLKVGDKVTTIGGICGQVVHVKDDKFVLETSADQVRIEFAKWALSTNETAAEAAQAAAKKAQEDIAKAKAAKKAAKQNKNNR